MYDNFFKARVCFDYLYYTPSLRKVGKKYNVSKSSVSRWLRNYTVTHRKRRCKSLNATEKTFYRSFVKENAFCTLLELQKALKSKLQIVKSLSTISRELKKCKISRKRVSVKNSVPERTSDYDFERLAEALEGDPISIDETCFYYSECPKYGYALRGHSVTKNLNPYANAKRRSVSLLVAITRDRIIDYRLRNASFDSQSFKDFIDGINAKEGTKLVLDNVQFHKSTTVLNSYRIRNFVPVFIPPYSPQYNPIEYFFSSLKAKVRRYNHETFESITHVVSETIKLISNSNSNNIFNHCAKLCRAKVSK